MQSGRNDATADAPKPGGRRLANAGRLLRYADGLRLGKPGPVGRTGVGRRKRRLEGRYSMRDVEVGFGFWSAEPRSSVGVHRPSLQLGEVAGQPRPAKARSCQQAPEVLPVVKVLQLVVVVVHVLE